MRLILTSISSLLFLSGGENRKVSDLHSKSVSLCFPHKKFRNCIVSHQFVLNLVNLDELLLTVLLTKQFFLFGFSVQSSIKLVETLFRITRE